MLDDLEFVSATKMLNVGESVRIPSLDVPRIPTEISDPATVHFVNDGQNLIVLGQDEFSLFTVATQK